MFGDLLAGLGCGNRRVGLTALVALWTGTACLHAAAAAAPATTAAPAAMPATVMVVVGVAGAEEYGESFLRQAVAWQDTATKAGAKQVVIGLDESNSVADRDRLREALAAEPKEGAGVLWLVLIGHGTFDGREAKFNARGDDFNGTELAEWLKPFTRTVAVINTSSSSAPFLAKVTGPNRIVVTATRSGSEQNYARFGIHFADVIGSPAGDIDKDGETSLLEAYLSASATTAEWYKTEERLASEHPLLDDNGDSLGTPPDWYRGVRAVKRALNNAAPDGIRAHQLALLPSATERLLSPEVRSRRDGIERQIARLRDLKAQIDEAEYFRLLETLMLDLAKLYRENLPAAAGGS